MAATLVCVAPSARALVEAAVRDGFGAWAVDLFGDVDTRAAARRWSALGDAATLAPDGAALAAALDAAAREPDVAGWVAGGGFEAHPQLLDEGAARLPLLGTAPADQHRTRDARGFYARLDALGVPHPPVRFEPPADPEGWLLKRMASCGGLQVRPAAQGRAKAGDHWQRVAPGRPHSVLFVADGRRARRIAAQEQIARPLGRRPYAFHGAVGPVALPPGVGEAVDRLLDALAETYRLRGLAGLDLVVDDAGGWQVLELNPRPPASVQLYPDAGLMRRHVAACLDSRLDDDAAPTAGEGRAWHGFEIVHAPCHVVAPALRPAAALHDVPPAGTPVPRGAPLCTVSAEAATREALRQALAARASAVLARCGAESTTIRSEETPR